MFRKLSRRVSASTVSILVFITMVLPIFHASATTTYLKVMNPATGDGNFTYTNVAPPPHDVSHPLGYVLANLTVVDVANLATWQVNVTWDPTLLKIDNIADIIYPPSNVFGSWYDGPIGLTRNPGSIFCVMGIKLAAPFDSFNGSGRLCQIRFKIVKNDTGGLSGSIHIDTTALFKTKLIDTEGELIPFTPVDGSYVIPEFPTSILPLLFVITTLCVFAFKKKALLAKWHTNAK